MITSPSILKISAALVKAQATMGNAVKDSKNPFFKSSYADLNSIREAVMPALLANEIAVLQPTMIVDGKQVVRTLLLHSSGEFIGADTEIVCAKQNDPQAHGSAISYSRRYGLQALLNVGAVDDDGNSASGKSAAPAPSAPAAKSSFKKPDVKPAAPKVEEKKADEMPGTIEEGDSWL